MCSDQNILTHPFIHSPNLTTKYLAHPQLHHSSTHPIHLSVRPAVSSVNQSIIQIVWKSVYLPEWWSTLLRLNSIWKAHWSYSSISVFGSVTALSGPHVIPPRQLPAQHCITLHWRKMNHWKHWNSSLWGSSSVSASTPTSDLQISSGLKRLYVNKCPWKEWCTSLGRGHTSHGAMVTRCRSFPHECRFVNHKLHQG